MGWCEVVGIYCILVVRDKGPDEVEDEDDDEVEDEY
jgi:hypothetical protein